MTERICIHCYVSGRVQGVWFRAGTKEEADKLGITGWVRNLPDKRVEVLALGEKEKIKLFYEWLKQGPALSEVTDIFYEELPLEEHSQFVIV